VRDIFGFIGIENIEFVSADNLDFGGPEAENVSLSNAQRTIDELVAAF
jgi:FMN-dependent NADH-azoreductase